MPKHDLEHDVKGDLWNTTRPALALRTAENAPPAVTPRDRIYSGLFGQGEVLDLLKNAEGQPCGHRIRFENGMEAQLLITGLPVRH